VQTIGDTIDICAC